MENLSDSKEVNQAVRNNPQKFPCGYVFQLDKDEKEDQPLAIVDTFVQARELARTMENLQEVPDGGEQQKTLLHRTGALLSEMVSKNLATSSSETEIELNFAVVRIRHKVIRKEE